MCPEFERGDADPVYMSQKLRIFYRTFYYQAKTTNPLLMKLTQQNQRKTLIRSSKQN